MQRPSLLQIQEECLDGALAQRTGPFREGPGRIRSTSGSSANRPKNKNRPEMTLSKSGHLEYYRLSRMFTMPPPTCSGLNTAAEIGGHFS